MHAKKARINYTEEMLPFANALRPVEVDFPRMEMVAGASVGVKLRPELVQLQSLGNTSPDSEGILPVRMLRGHGRSCNYRSNSVCSAMLRCTGNAIRSRLERSFASWMNQVVYDVSSTAHSKNALSDPVVKSPAFTCGGPMIPRFVAVAVLALGAALSQAQPSLPSGFQARTIHSPEGADIFVRWAGKGPVVVLLHGYAENSDSWAPLAADLVKDHTLVVPDLRGIGRSSKPVGGYDKKTEAKDIRAVVTALGYDKTVVVAHDIGNMVAYAYAAMYPDKVERLVVMDAPIPGIGPWAEILQTPGVWHFNFHGPDAERLVAGRERIYLDRIWNDFTGDPAKPDEATRNFFAATYTVSLIRKFIDSPPGSGARAAGSNGVATGEERLTSAEYRFPQHGNPGTGSSGVGGIETVVLKGNPDQAGVYTIMLRLPAHTRIAAHSHRDDRVATVISGAWHIGYGDSFDESKLKALPPGSFYTEPPGRPHFAPTPDQPLLVPITRFSPPPPPYIYPAQDPRRPH